MRPLLMLAVLLLVPAAGLGGVDTYGSGEGDRGRGRGPEAAKLEGARYEQNIGGRLPLDAVFVNSSGSVRTLRDWVDGKPTLMVLGYYDCPMLCSLVHQGIAKAIRAADSPQMSKFRLLSVSIDPGEGMRLADRQRTAFLSQSGLDGKAVDFLSGQERSIERLAEAAGFHYSFDAETDTYSHPAGFFVVTPSGKISQYFLGVQFEPEALSAAVQRASEEREGTSVRDLVLRCFAYDPDTSPLGWAVMLALRGMAVLTVASLIFFIGFTRTRRPVPGKGDSAHE